MPGDRENCKSLKIISLLSVKNIKIHNVEKVLLFDSSVTTTPIYFCIHDPNHQ